MTLLRSTVILLAITNLLISCKTFHAKQARGEAGIVRIPQFENVVLPSNHKNHDEKCEICVENNKKGKVKDQGTFLWSYYNGNRRGSVMYVKDGKIRVLAENAPDAALQTIANITAKADVVGQVDAEVKYNTTKTIAQLGKRTAAVNMLRDALYRLNELYYASLEYEKEMKDKHSTVLEGKTSLPQTFHTINLSKTEFIEIFTRIIDNAKDISINESKAESEIAKSESEAEVEKEKAQGKRYETLLAAFEKVEGKLSKDEVEKLLLEYMDKK